MITKNYDFIVIGAGLIGLSTAYQILLKKPNTSVLVLEKEPRVSVHQSGHNSGVVHSGIYYKPGSLKAINCILGYELLVNFVKQYDVPFDLCGKVIVATSESELAALDKIYNRGVKNGLTGLKKINQAELLEYEPHVAGIAGILVPKTGIIDYSFLAHKLKEIIFSLGVEVHFNEKVLNIFKSGNDHVVETNKANYTTRKIISCAGLQSDRITSLTNPNNDLRIIPFRGEYYKVKPEKEYLIKNLVYPVPDANFPFLGVHFTRMIQGGIEAGPNAVLAFKREGYKFTDFNLKDSIDTLTWPGFWKIAAKYGKTGIGEIYRSLYKGAFTKALQKLVPEITENDLMSGGAGVRAQACDRNGNLIDDFNIVETENIIHVRNAPSPAATSCLSIGRTIRDLVL